MKKRGVDILLFIILIGIMGFIFGCYISSSYSKIQEGARTLPRPQRHPVTSNNQINVASVNQANIPLNTRVDGLISQYFDVNEFVLPRTISTYVQDWTNKGNVDPKTKEKLTDIGYYLLTNVMPNIPTATLPPPTVNWPKIQWTSDGWFPMTDVANIWSNFGYGNSANFRDFRINEYNEFTLSSSSPSPSSSSSGGAEGGETDTNDDQNCGSNGTSGCGNVCPTSCFANSFMQNNAESSYDSEVVVATNTGGTGSNSDACQSFFRQNEGISISANYFGSTTVNIVTTDISQTNMTLPSPLDTQLNETINLYFDVDTGYPTEYAIQTFNDIVQNATPIDLLHKNKLRDVIYYFMENIIPGLPTNAKPVSYVEWIPIRWLSHSSI